MGLKIYLAGFDVFRPDAVAHGERLKALCAEFGHEGLYPLDNQLPPELKGPTAARWICDANLALIHQADLVLANLNPFRGHEPDSGTAFEVGYARARGMHVWAYMEDDRPMTLQVGGLTDALSFSVEDFELPCNLMLACSVRWVRGGPRDALIALGSAPALATFTELRS